MDARSNRNGTSPFRRHKLPVPGINRAFDIDIDRFGLFFLGRRGLGSGRSSRGVRLCARRAHYRQSAEQNKPTSQRKYRVCHLAFLSQAC